MGSVYEIRTTHTMFKPFFEESLSFIECNLIHVPLKEILPKKKLLQIHTAEHFYGTEVEAKRQFHT